MKPNDVIVKPNNTIIFKPNITVSEPTNNTKIEEILQGMNKKEQQPAIYSQGDVLIASSTIIAFFGFGSFLVIRFENRRPKDLKLMIKQMNGILLSVFLVQVLHIIILISVIIGLFSPVLYFAVLMYTVSLLYIIFVSVRTILRTENEIEEQLEKTNIKFKPAQKDIEAKRREKAYFDYSVKDIEKLLSDTEKYDPKTRTRKD